MAVARRTSQRVTLVMLLLASATLVTLDFKGDGGHAISAVRNTARDVFAPAQRLISDALHPIGDLFAGAVNYGDLQAQNQQLQKQIGVIERINAEEALFEQQFEQLLQLESLPYAANIPTVTAAIINGSPSDFDREIEIDKGSSSGIGPDMPVVAGPGLAGVVSSVSTSTAMVRLVTNPQVQIGVRFGDNEEAVVQGAGPGADLNLTQLESSEPVSVGEVIYTSGLTPAAYPSAIPIGTVGSVQPVKGSYTTAVTVEPYVDFNTLQYVDVMLWMPPA